MLSSLASGAIARAKSTTRGGEAGYVDFAAVHSIKRVDDELNGLGERDPKARHPIVGDWEPTPSATAETAG